MKCLTGVAMPDTFECGEKALGVLLSKMPAKADVENILSILSMAGMKIVENAALPKNEIHAVSYRTEGGQTVRTLRKIFNLEVSWHMTPETDWFTLFVIIFSAVSALIFGVLFVLHEIAELDRRKFLDRLNEEHPNKPRILY